MSRKTAIFVRCCYKVVPKHCCVAPDSIQSNNKIVSWEKIYYWLPTNVRSLEFASQLSSDISGLKFTGVAWVCMLKINLNCYLQVCRTRRAMRKLTPIFPHIKQWIAVQNNNNIKRNTSKEKWLMYLMSLLAVPEIHSAVS